MINIRFYTLIICCCLFVFKAKSQAPVLQTIVASDPDNLDGIYSLGDVFTLTFDVATNQTAINTKAEIDAIFAFSENLGTNYTGVWLSPTVAEITVTGIANHASPTIGSTTVNVVAASPLMDVGNTLAATAGTYGAITGSFGTGANEPFFGGDASGTVFATLAANCPSSIFEGGDSSGHFVAELLQACPTGIFKGDSLSGYARNDLDGGQNCQFFKGEEGSGAQVEEYRNPYTCVQFFATVSGSDGADQRSYSDDNGGCVLITLPIEGSPLFAKVVENRGRLYWWTYTEENNEGFELQKSNNGSDWEQIAWVNGAGNSLSEIAYEAWDDNLNQGVQYYRYIQYDFDGTEHISNMVALEHNMPNQDVVKDELIQLSIFPNPLLKGNNLKIKSWYSGELSTVIRVYNLLGQELLTKNHLFSPTESLIELGTQNLPQGTYITTIENKSLGILKTIKFIVID